MTVFKIDPSKMTAGALIYWELKGEGVDLELDPKKWKLKAKTEDGELMPEQHTLITQNTEAIKRYLLWHISWDWIKRNIRVDLQQGHFKLAEEEAEEAYDNGSVEEYKQALRRLMAAAVEAPKQEVML